MSRCLGHSLSADHISASKRSNKERYFPAAFRLAAQRAFNAATILALPSGVSPPFFFPGFDLGAALTDLPLTFAQRAFCAATILARPAADILLPRFLPLFAGAVDGVMDLPPKI